MTDGGWAALPPELTPITHDAFLLDVDGHRFEVAPDGPGTYHYTWSTGPNEGYGFTVGSSTGADSDATAHAQRIRAFLAEIDPKTGYIED